MLSEDTRDNVLAYYVWAMQADPADITYPHQTPFRRLLGSGIGCEGLSDDEAMAIDRALSALQQEYPSDAEVVRLVIRDNRSFRWLEKRGYGNRKALASALSESLKYIKGHIDSALAAA